jgi:hypothetical protein
MHNHHRRRHRTSTLRWVNCMRTSRSVAHNVQASVSVHAAAARRQSHRDVLSSPATLSASWALPLSAPRKPITMKKFVTVSSDSAVPCSQSTLASEVL